MFNKILIALKEYNTSRLNKATKIKMHSSYLAEEIIKTNVWVMPMPKYQYFQNCLLFGLKVEINDNIKGFEIE